MDADKHFVTGVFDDEDVLLTAVKKVKDSGVKKASATCLLAFKFMELMVCAEG